MCVYVWCSCGAVGDQGRGGGSELIKCNNAMWGDLAACVLIKKLQEKKRRQKNSEKCDREENIHQVTEFKRRRKIYCDETFTRLKESCFILGHSLGEIINILCLNKIKKHFYQNTELFL